MILFVDLKKKMDEFEIKFADFECFSKSTLFKILWKNWRVKSHQMSIPWITNFVLFATFPSSWLRTSTEKRLVKNAFSLALWILKRTWINYATATQVGKLTPAHFSKRDRLFVSFVPVDCRALFSFPTFVLENKFCQSRKPREGPREGKVCLSTKS